MKSIKTPIICHLSPFSSEYGGTFVDSLLHLARYCRDNIQLETMCIFPEAARSREWLKAFDAEGIRCEFIPRRRNVVSDVRLLLRELEPSIFHTHFSTYDLSPIFLKLVSYRDSKIVWHYHNAGATTLLQRIKDVIKIRFLARYFGVSCIAVGDGVFNSLIGAGLSAKNLLLVHNGINTSRFHSSSDVRKRARELLGVSEGQVVFLLLGWEPFRKGVDIFVKAAFDVVSTNSGKSLFLIVGRKETREFVAKLPEYTGLGSSVRVIDPIEDFSSLVNGIDVLVSSSRSEGLPYAVSEAMATEKLVLCSDIPGMREIYGKSAGVWFFPTEDWKMLAALMQRIEVLPDVERDQLSKTSSEYVRTQLSLDVWVEKIAKIYRNLLQS
jgi:glycosyltransferase involved in cell wall biosynthesis